MFQKFVLLCFTSILAAAYAKEKDIGSKSTTQKTPELENRFFGLENIFGQMFNGLNPPGNPFGGLGGHFQHSPPEYQNQFQQNPQAQYNNWQNIQTPNQAQSNLNQYPQSTQYPQGGFNSQNNFVPGANQNVQSQQFPNQGLFNQQSNMNQYPSQSTQGNLNTGSSGQNLNAGTNFNSGTLDSVPPQTGIQGSTGSWNQNPGNFDFQNQQGNQNAGFQNGNQMGFQNQGSQDGYNPVAILGKPVHVTTSVPDSIVFEDGGDTPAKRQCVQDCQSSTEYNPVCGSNNVTYFNPGRFICARNCGINVFIQRDGRCDKF